jgi:mono/diheme cytochrome c family protein
MTVCVRFSKGLVVFATLAAATGLALGAGPRAETPPAVVSPVEAGRLIAERDCSSCHAVGPAGESPLEGAPRWRDLHSRFPVDDLAEALAEGISVGHPGMPDGAYEPADVQALIAYLKTLEPAAPAVTPK